MENKTMKIEDVKLSESTCRTIGMLMYDWSTKHVNDVDYIKKYNRRLHRLTNYFKREKLKEIDKSV